MSELKRQNFSWRPDSALWWLLAALIILVFADLEISAVDPWLELGRMAGGFTSPDWSQVDIGTALLTTFSFAIQGVALGSVLGFIFSLFIQWWPVRLFCALIRAVHELFWALIFLQIFGLSPLTGVLAIAIPYAGIFAKVYGELIEGQGRKRQRGLEQADTLSLQLFSQVAGVWPSIKAYTAYRTECALRSSVVLGFIGLPTLGYHLESAFSAGYYAESAALLYILIALIGTLRWWLDRRLVVLYLLFSLWYLPPLLDSSSIADLGVVWQFFSQEALPAPLRSELGWSAWLSPLLDQISSGAVVTLALAFLAMLFSGFLALLQFPLVSPLLLGRKGRFPGAYLFNCAALGARAGIGLFIFTATGAVVAASHSCARCTQWCYCCSFIRALQLRDYTAYRCSQGLDALCL